MNMMKKNTSNGTGRKLRKRIQLGEEAGYKLGAQQKVMDQVKKKLARGASVDEIASALEEEPETIKEIMDALK